MNILNVPIPLLMLITFLIVGVTILIVNLIRLIRLVSDVDLDKDINHPGQTQYKKVTQKKVFKRLKRISIFFFWSLGVLGFLIHVIAFDNNSKLSPSGKFIVKVNNHGDIRYITESANSSFISLIAIGFIGFFLSFLIFGWRKEEDI